MEERSNTEVHEPVLIEEVLSFLNLVRAPLKKQAYKPKIIDATLGTGGHTISFLKAGANVLGLDLDKNTIEVAKKRIKESSPTLNNNIESSFKAVYGNFRFIDKLAEENGFSEPDGILFDLGVSTPQLVSKTRGFSFSKKETDLDMRLDSQYQAVTAFDLLNGLPEKKLIILFSRTLSNNKARNLVKRIVKRRERKPFKTVGDFLDLLDLGEKGRIHPATKPFLALRMAVNSELENIEQALPRAFSLLKRKGRLAVISFHSGEDLIVKEFFKEMQKSDQGRVLTKKPIIPSEIEIKRNPKSRSAKLRVIEKNEK